MLDASACCAEPLEGFDCLGGEVGRFVGDLERGRTVPPLPSSSPDAVVTVVLPPLAMMCAEV